jgi:hypothetical protein
MNDATDARFEFHRVLRREPAPHTVAWLAKRLQAYPERGMRQAVLAQIAADAPLAPLVRLLSCAQRESVRGDSAARDMLDVVTTTLARGLLPSEVVAGLTATLATPSL